MSERTQSRFGRLALAVASLTLAGCAGQRGAVEGPPDPRSANVEEEAETPGEAGSASSGTASSASEDGAVPELPPRPLTPVQRAALRVASLEVVPSEFELEVGDQVTAEVLALDETGQPVEGAQILRLIQGRAAWFDPGTRTVNASRSTGAPLLSAWAR